MKIVFTGGGSAGHVVPNLPIIDQLLDSNWEVFYLGSYSGPENEIIQAHSNNINYRKIATDKLRRYFSFRTLLTPFIVVFGILQAFVYLVKIKPDVVFSKGGFVGFPVIISAKLLRVPVLSHESDVSRGLANRLTMPFVSKLCMAAPLDWLETREDKMVSTGIPLRREIVSPQESNSFPFDIHKSKEVLLVFGGSLGATTINTIIRESIHDLVKRFTVIHITGVGKIDSEINVNDYHQTEYISQEMGILLKRADLVICRAGMTTIFELLVQKKSAILIPLPLSASRGDQIENAALMKEKDLFEVLLEEDLNPNSLNDSIKSAFVSQDKRFVNIENISIDFSANTIVNEILKMV